MKTPGKIASIAIIVVISAFTIAACGHHRPHDPQERAEWMLQRVTDHLDLDEQQQAKLRAIKMEIETSVKKHREQQHQLFDRLAANIESPELDKALLMEIVETRKQAFDDTAPLIIDKLIEFHASLNPEQKKKVADKMEHFREHFQKHHAG